MALNRINWTPKEQLFDYHVLTWKTSHLHPKTKVGVSGGAELRERAGGAAVSGSESAQPDGIVPGYGRRDSRYRSGGLGRDGKAQDGDSVSVSTYRSGRQGSGDVQEAAAASMPCADIQTQEAMQTAALQTVQDAAQTFSAGRAVRKAGGRMKETAGHVQKKAGKGDAAYERRSCRAAAEGAAGHPQGQPGGSAVHAGGESLSAGFL